MICKIALCLSFIVLLIVKTINEINCDQISTKSPELGVANRKNNQTNFNNSTSDSRSVDEVKDASFYVILVVLIIFCGAFVVGSVYTYFYNKKKTYDSIDPELKRPVKLSQLSKSVVEDLPSSDVETIVMPSNELKPVDNSHFNWKQKPRVKKVEENKVNDKETKVTETKVKPKAKN